MNPYYQDNHTTLYNQNFLDNDLPDESVQMVVTSPPYWGLRKYSGDQDLIWNNGHCPGHEWGEEIETGDNRYRGENSIVGGNHNAAVWGGGKMLSQFCQICAAWRGAYGLEPTPEMYVDHTIEVLREIRRVLRKDGVVFWNIGDSYAGSGRGADGKYANESLSKDSLEVKPDWNKTSLKPKDLCLIPFRVAIAAQTDGWWVRSVIIWNKPNPMPESVTDRPTESHEYVLMLTKSAKYYWDAEAVREPVAESTLGRGPVDFGGAKGRAYQPDKNDPNFRNGSEQWGRTYDYTKSSAGGRNLRTVWTFPTQPYPEAHFAVFPEKLPEICIKAATPEYGCCSKCGMPYERQIETEYRNQSKSDTEKYAKPAFGTKVTFGRGNVETKTIGWQPCCKCNAETVPSVVLDPFAGAGTALWVAKKLNRRSIGYELSAEYCNLIVERNRQQALI